MNHTKTGATPKPNPADTWTAAIVKIRKPHVQVMVKPDKPVPEQTVVGHVVGEREGFAIVSFQWYGVTVSCDVAWDTVANCLNGNRPILY